MHIFLVSAIIFISILLVLVILAQNPKGGGLSSQFGGSGASNLIGIKKTGDLLEKLTWGCIFAIIGLSLATHFTVTLTGSTEESDGIIERANEQQDVSDTELNLQLPSSSETPQNEDTVK